MRPPVHQVSGLNAPDCCGEGHTRATTSGMYQMGNCIGRSASDVQGDVAIRPTALVLLRTLASDSMAT